MVKKKIQNKKSDVFELKKDLVEDLDQFLLDADFGVASVKEEKQKALQELDKLIKQDLSYSQILNSIKKEVKAEIKIEETEKVQNLEDLATNSAHVIDLRKSKVEPSVKPKFDFAKYKDSFIKSYGKSTKKINWQLPKIKNTSFSVALNKSLLFALIVAVILLPIRGMVMFGQIKNDKGKILNFSQEGLISLQSGVI